MWFTHPLLFTEVWSASHPLHMHYLCQSPPFYMKVNLFTVHSICVFKTHFIKLSVIFHSGIPLLLYMVCCGAPYVRWPFNISQDSKDT